MLTSYVMDHDMNVPILLGYFQPVYLGDQTHMILGLDHHQPSSPTTLCLICVLGQKLSKDACPLAMIHSALKLLEYSNICGLEYSRKKLLIL